jgi:hypothetical protein
MAVARTLNLQSYLFYRATRFKRPPAIAPCIALTSTSLWKSMGYEPFRHILCLQMLKNKTISALLDASVVIVTFLMENFKNFHEFTISKVI